jgi:CspA family cold shock protein
MSERISGVVKWFSNERGYGFVLKDGVSDNGEYFVHFSSIIMEGYKTLKAGQKVTFELKETDKGTQAANVMLDE